MKNTTILNWEHCTNVTGNTLEVKCEGLKSSHQYRFRVVAKNVAGTSGPKEMTGNDIITKWYQGK